MNLDEWVQSFYRLHPEYNENTVRKIGGAAWLVAFGEGWDAAKDDYEGDS